MKTDYARQRRSEVRKDDVSVRLDQDLARVLRDLAEERKISLGAIVERALDAYFREVKREAEAATPAS
jgi:predicted transcriptional regulator